MKKFAILTVALLGTLGLQAQPFKTLEQVAAGWEQQTITDVKSGDILELFEAFHKTWPTPTGRSIKAFSRRPPSQDDSGVWHVIDHQNGYIGYTDDSPDSNNDVSMYACVWRRSNGHRLLAVNIHRFEPTALDILCFYDYDAQSATLTPEKRLAKLFQPSFPGYSYRVELPQKGKEMVIDEHFGWLSISHTYGWDGMKPVLRDTKIERTNMLQAMFRETYFFDTDQPLSQYALIDVDGDGMPELWLQTADGQYQAAFSVWPTVELIGGQDGRLNLSFYRGAVCSAGTCGALCLMSRYVFLEDSSPRKWLTEMSEWDHQLDDYGPSTYSLQGEQITEAEGERMVKALGEPIEFTPRWRKMKIETSN